MTVSLTVLGLITLKCTDIDEQFFRYYGGSLNLLDKKGIKEWMPTVIGDPWLFRGNLKPIYELISNATKKTNMKLAVQVHLDKAYLTVRLEQP